MTFNELDLLPQLQRAVAEMGYTVPTPIQAQSIPVLLQRRDLIGCAQTGTGKTCAFALPILQNLSEEQLSGRRPIRALILTPTRELARQIGDNFTAYGKYLKLRSTVIFGGVGQAPQVDALSRGVDILVATPGRLNDLCNQGFIDLSHVETFVLDEADRMLDMGFIHDVKKVIARLPSAHQTLLFSATMPAEIASLATRILHDPEQVEVTPVSSTVDAISQCVYKIDKGNKRLLLDRLLTDHPEYDSVLVFTRTKHGADKVVKDLVKSGFSAMAIHGNKSQSARVKALDSFEAGAIRLLVATDIAARGIDISGLSCVVNYELPNVPETYVHRIGRTGRAGHDGMAISFCNFDELPYLKDIEKLIGKPVPVNEDNPWPMAIFEAAPKAERPPRPARDGQSPRGGRPRTDAKPAAKPAGRTGKAPAQAGARPAAFHGEKTQSGAKPGQSGKPRRGGRRPGQGGRPHAAGTK